MKGLSGDIRACPETLGTSYMTQAFRQLFLDMLQMTEDVPTEDEILRLGREQPLLPEQKARILGRICQEPHPPRPCATFRKSPK